MVGQMCTMIRRCMYGGSDVYNDTEVYDVWWVRCVQ